MQPTSAWMAAAIALLATACTEPVTPKGKLKPRAKPPERIGDIPFLEAVRASGPIKIDGKLDENAWLTAYSTPPFVEPNRGVPATTLHGRTWILYDAENLYVGIRVEDHDPRSPFSPTELDPHIWQEASGVDLMIQPGDPGDNVHYFEIEVDPRGAVFDTQWVDYNTPISGMPGPITFGYESWSSQARVATTVVNGKGYFVELAIPWAAFPPRANVMIPPRPGQIWRMNFYAFTPGMRETVAWSPILGKGNFHRTSRFGYVRFAGR